jgi:hypothetical protein
MSSTSQSATRFAPAWKRDVHRERAGGPLDRVVRPACKSRHWGVIQISLANLIVIGLMILVFVLALFLPSPPRWR